MQRWNSLADIPAGYGPTVATLGNFDGMHLGHQGLIRTVVARARERGAKAVAVTFHPHPAVIHQAARELPQLQGLEDRLDAIEALGVDAVLVVPYTLEFSRLTPWQFAHDYLVRALAVDEVVVGRDAHFGADNSGDLATMRRLGEELGFAVLGIEDWSDPDGAAGARWSSSAARSALAGGDAAGAARVLGRPHRVIGEVVRGDGRGRALGFPTANLGGDISGMIPADGVYAGYIVRLAPPAAAQDALLPAAISVGVNPTFAGVGSLDRRVEAYALGRDDLELYGERVAVDFVARLRHTLAFADPAALVTQMHDDAAAAARVLLGDRLAAPGG
ncbi:MAG: bifunctional riboflavin kinase/FAD synthetase [Bifidobacteriaceae bacterium]|nr:bifunctional riboflavin kinase/FAD synthetase [Bifidobacteriaceae bacterium]